MLSFIKTTPLILLSILIILTGCGNEQSLLKNRVILNNKVQKAEIKIFKIENNGTLNLLFTEQTNSLGSFDTHIKDLNDENFYIYQASGGNDKKGDNRGNLRAIIKGEVLKNIEKFNITYLSELVYEKVVKDLKNYDKNELEKRLNQYAFNLIEKDINKDSHIDIKDIYTFDPSKDKNKLVYSYKKMKKIL